MKTIRRVMRGSIASWIRLVITAGLQIILVPLYLAYWDAATYGIWLSIISAATLLDMLSLGLMTYIGNEFMRIAHIDRSSISDFYSTCLPISFLIGALQLLFAFCVVKFGLFAFILGAIPLGDARNGVDGGHVLILIALTTFLCGSLGGVLVRLLSAIGYFSSVTYFGLLGSLITSISPLFSIVMGGDILQAGYVLVTSIFIYNVFFIHYAFILLKREGIYFSHQSWRGGVDMAHKSTLVSLRILLEQGRQQGVRLILSPIVGASDMAAYSTMRTGSSAIQQGLGSITGPLMPELAGYLIRGDQKKVEISFSLVWIICCGIMAPALILLQYIAPSVFSLWTRGKFQYDAELFALFSLATLLYGVSQPALAIIQGRNLLRPQLVLSMLTALVLVGGVFLFTPRLGIAGAGYALLISEAIAFLMSWAIAKKWLLENNMIWPFDKFIYIIFSLILTGLGLIVIAKFKSIFLVILLICILLGLMAKYLSLMPFKFNIMMKKLFINN